MTLDGFLGFLALFIAFYAIISPVARLRAQLHLAKQFLFAFLAVALVLYFEFFPLVGQPCWLANKEICKWITFRPDDKFTPQQAAFLVVFIWMILAFLINKFLKPGPRALPGISKIVQELLYDHRFSELLDFIRPHLSLIEATALSQRKAKGDAETIVRMLLRSEELRKFIVSMRPDVLPDLMAINLQPRFDFADKVLRDLITDNGSRLYQEIENNQNLANNGGYWIPEENTLLKYLFSDAEVARKLGAWEPIGDYVVNKIRDGSKIGYIEYLNEPANNFDTEQWSDSTFVAIRYFDIMVHEAMRQGVADHMWLFYLQYFVDELERCYDASATNVDQMAEFPTRNARLIYSVFDTLGDWIKAIEHREVDSPHAVTDDTNDHSLSVIPIAASVSLGNVMVTVALSSRIDDRFAAYMHECVLSDMSSLSRQGQEGRMRAALIRAIVAGGNRNRNAVYGERLRVFLEMADHVLRGNVDDYVEAIEAAFPAT